MMTCESDLPLKIPKYAVIALTDSFDWTESIEITIDYLNRKREKKTSSRNSMSNTRISSSLVFQDNKPFVVFSSLWLDRIYLSDDHQCRDVSEIYLVKFWMHLVYFNESKRESCRVSEFSFSFSVKYLHITIEEDERLIFHYKLVEEDKKNTGNR